MNTTDIGDPRPAQARVKLGWLGLGFVTGAIASAVALASQPLNRTLPQSPALPVLASSRAPLLAAAEASPAEPVSEAEAPQAAVLTGPELPARGQARSNVAQGPMIVATARSTYIYSAPSFDSPRLGYLRGGQAVERARDPAGFEGCPGGFFAIEPAGFVCAGEWASIDPEHPALELLALRPDRRSVLPYRYGMSRFPTPPFYSRIPSYLERASQEPELHYHVRHVGSTGWRALGLEPVPPMLEGGGSALRHDGQSQAGSALSSGRAIPGSGFAFASLFESDGYQYGMSTDLAIMPLDRLTPVEPSRFGGVVLGGRMDLPLAFVQRAGALLYVADPRREGHLGAGRALEHREAFSLSGNRVQIDEVSYRETRGGDWLREQDLALIEPLSRAPTWLGSGDRWLDISILQQTLVAYVGDRPVFATLVSTGRDGLGAAKGAQSTIVGTFMIHTKHVSWHMSSNAEGAAYDLRDVPYVQYFHEGFALHAAYWHDGFGRPRSHGCVNVSPKDARWLFEWSEPRVPEAWHGAFSLQGTRVHIHP